MSSRAMREARATRELHDQRTKFEQFASMMNEVEEDDSSEDSEDDAPVRPRRRRPMRGGAGGGGGRSGRAEGKEVDDDPGLAGAGRSLGAMAAAVYTETEDDAITNFGTASSAAAPVTSPVAETVARDLQALLLRPVHPDAGVKRCYVIRNKTGRFMLNPLWSVFNDEDHKFLMAGRKRMGKKTSNYLVSTDTDIDRKSVGVVGKVRANWTGSGYHLYDHGMNPAKSKTDASIRRDLGFVSFDYDTMGPGKMEIAVPRVTTGGVPVELRPRSEEDATSEQLYKENNTEKLMTLTNKRPKWDETVKGHVLNFQGRVTMSSVKNFQLACSETGDLTVLQFGRVGDNKFTMDYRYPLSAFQAFGIVLASLDGKLADSKGFSKLKSKFVSKKK